MSVILANNTPVRRTLRTLILGYGNPGRQDDGLGAALADAIAARAIRNVTVQENYQLNIEDALDVAEHDIVWFVDAARTGPTPFSVTDIVPAAGIELSSHIVRPEVILAIAQKYFGKSPRAYLLGIRGYEFEFVEHLTLGATTNLLAALKMLEDSICSASAELVS